MCDMDAIGELARKHDLKVIEDIAHQHGSRWRDVGAGALGDAGSFSFQQSKVLTSGEGGSHYLPTTRSSTWPSPSSRWAGRRRRT
jgi:dTDP-4-amino-4,6-dideoxygalactose transaminase